MAGMEAPSPAALVRSSRFCSCVFGTAVSRAEGGFSLPGVLGGHLKTHMGMGPWTRESCPCQEQVTCSGHLPQFCAPISASGRHKGVQAGILPGAPFPPVPRCCKLTHKDIHAHRAGFCITEVIIRLPREKTYHGNTQNRGLAHGGPQEASLTSPVAGGPDVFPPARLQPGEDSTNPGPMGK